LNAGFAVARNHVETTLKPVITHERTKKSPLRRSGPNTPATG
jgi:hypothetical protein